MVEVHVAARSPVLAYRFSEIQSLGEARDVTQAVKARL
jgi:hypothetical protein